MLAKLLFASLVLSSFSFAGNVGVEYAGIMVATQTTDKQQKSYVVKPREVEYSK